MIIWNRNTIIWYKKHNCCYKRTLSNLFNKKNFYTIRTSGIQLIKWWNWINGIYWFARLCFSCFCPYETIRIDHECEGRIEKSVPRITFWHHEACRVMTNGDHEGRIFLFHPHTNNGFFFLLTIKTHILCLKKAPRSSWIRWDVTYYDEVTWWPYAWVQLQPMYSLHMTGWVR